MSGRLPDWRLQLQDYVARTSAEPFAPGVLDCALFAAGAVEAMTGRDLAAPFRGKYTTEIEGLRLLREMGFGDLWTLTASVFDAVPVAMAAVGDLAIVPGVGGEALGVVQGAHIYVRRRDGLATVDLTDALAAFRVA